MPQSKILSTKKVSEVLKIEPTFKALLILSKTITKGVFLHFLNSSIVIVFISLLFNFFMSYICCNIT